MSIPNTFQPPKQAKMKITCLVPENLLIAFLPIYFFYWDAMAIFNLFKNILSKTEEIKPKKPNSSSLFNTFSFFFNKWAINMDPYCVEAHCNTMHHYNLSPAFQGQTSGKTKSLFTFSCPNYSKSIQRDFRSYHIHV